VSRITSAALPGGSEGSARVAGPDGAAFPQDGRSTRWADHRAARRAELAQVARKAVHHHGPDVSMDEIAAAGGTSKSIVYRYFADKNGLQAAVGEVVLADMHARLDEAVRTASTPRDGLRSMIGAYLEMVESSPNVYWFVTRPVAEDSSVTLGRFLDAIAVLIARPFVALLAGRDGADAPVGQTADVWAAGAVGFVRGAGDWWLAHRDEPDAPSREELTDRITAWLWAGPVSALSARPSTRTSPTTSPTTPPARLDDEEHR
jgi:AcrR family transcriptional regulator